MCVCVWRRLRSLSVCSRCCGRRRDNGGAQVGDDEKRKTFAGCFIAMDYGAQKTTGPYARHEFSVIFCFCNYETIKSVGFYTEHVGMRNDDVNMVWRGAGVGLG